MLEKENDGIGFNITLNVLNAVSTIIDSLTLPIYWIIDKPWRTRNLAKQKQNLDIFSESNSITFTTVAKPSEYHELIVRENLHSMSKFFHFITPRYSKRNCLKISKQWLDFETVNNLILNFGRGLKRMKSTKIALLGDYQVEWLLVLHSAFQQNIPVVLINTNVGNALIKCINDSNVTTIVTTNQNLFVIQNNIELMPSVKDFLLLGDEIETNFCPIKTFEEVIEFGKENFGISDLDVNCACSDDIAIITYTSNAKENLIKHKDLITSLKGLCDCIDSEQKYILTSSKVGGSIFEIMVQNTVLFKGNSVGSDFMKTSNSEFSLLPFCTTIRSSIKDIARILLRDLENNSIFRRILLKFLYRYRKYWSEKGFKTRLIDFLLDKYGIYLNRLLLSNESFVSEEIQNILNFFGLKIVLMFGLSENIFVESVVKTSTLCEFKIMKFDNANYLDETLKGELFIRFQEKEWMSTGDVIEINKFNQIRLVDKKENLLTLSFENNVFLSDLENKFKSMFLVDDICLIGEESFPFLVALVIPNRKNLEELMKSDLNCTELYQVVNTELAVIEKLEEFGRRNNLKEFEIPIFIKLLDEEWTVENGFLDPFSKQLNRQFIKEQYISIVQQLFYSLELYLEFLSKKTNTGISESSSGDWCEHVTFNSDDY